MSGIAIYENAFYIDGRGFDIVVSAPGLNGPIQDDRVVQATTQLFLNTVARANGVDQANISAKDLKATVLQIDATGQAFIKVDNEEVSVDDIPNIPEELQELAGLAGRVTISAQDTISAIRDLQFTQIVHTQVRSDDESSSSFSFRPTSTHDEDDQKTGDENPPGGRSLFTNKPPRIGSSPPQNRTLRDRVYEELRSLN